MVSRRLSRHATLQYCLVIGHAALMLGCQPASPPLKPIDVSKAAMELESLHGLVRQFANGDTDVNGHESVHRIGTLLKELSTLDETCGADEETRAIIATAAESMMNIYADLEQSIHDEKSIDYGAVEAKLSDRLDEIKSIATPSMQTN